MEKCYFYPYRLERLNLSHLLCKLFCLHTASDPPFLLISNAKLYSLCHCSGICSPVGVKRLVTGTSLLILILALWILPAIGFIIVIIIIVITIVIVIIFSLRCVALGVGASQLLSLKCSTSISALKCSILI